MKSIIFLLSLVFTSLNSFAQKPYEINDETPIAIRASSIDYFNWYDTTGKLSPTEIIGKLSKFTNIATTENNYSKGKIWYLFKFKNNTEKNILLDIGYNFENQPVQIFTIENERVLPLKENASATKNNISFNNLLNENSKIYSTRNIRLNLEPESTKSILIQYNDLFLDKLFFRDGIIYDEWARGPLYVQGIFIGMLFSLMLLAAFSTYKYKDHATFWYFIFILITSFNYISTKNFDGTRFSEFISDINELYEIAGSAYLTAFVFHLYLYYSFDTKFNYPRLAKITTQLQALIIINFIIFAFIFFTPYVVNWEFSNFIDNSSIYFYTLEYSRLAIITILKLIFIYISINFIIKKDASSKFTTTALLLNLLAWGSYSVINKLFEKSDFIFYNDMYYFGIMLLNILVLVIMGFGTISRSKEIQDQLISTTEEKKNLVMAQNEMLETKVKERTHELHLESQKSERLMLNILPESIASRLKAGDESISDSYQNATILFSDLVGFTKMSSSKTAEELVFLLNDLFKRFDTRATSLGLEKIKTIGDAYMVAGGLPTHDDKHAIQVTKMALGMYEDLEAFNKEHDMALGMRIGINSGPVVAGVIGHSKFSYDIWGNTVNTASRMESTCSPGKVQVSPSTYEQIKGHFDIQENQLVECKGLGQIMTYFVK
jgi:class 3 adenylate cyclase